MTLTLKELEAVASEMDRVLARARLVGLGLVDAETVVLSFDTGQGEVRVLVCVRPRHSRIHLTSRPLPKVLRHRSHPFLETAKAFVGGRVSRVSVRFGDRVVGILLARMEEPTTQVRTHTRRHPHTAPMEHPLGSLLFECTGHHPNLFWTDPSDLILVSLVPSRSYRRDLRPGRRYQAPLPHPSDRMEALRFLPAREETFSALVEAHYERLERDEAQRLQEARARRDLRREIERLVRLRQALAEDLEEQEAAAARLEAGAVAPRDIERLRRLADRRQATRERLTRAERRIERLHRRLSGPGREGDG